MLAQRWPNVSKGQLNQCWPNVGVPLVHICITEAGNVASTCFTNVSTVHVYIKLNLLEFVVACTTLARCLTSIWAADPTLAQH